MHLTRTDEYADEIDGLAARYGGRVGVEAVLADLDRPLRRAFAPGLAVHEAWTWDRADRRSRRWWPQGVSVLAGGHQLAVSWYSKDGGSRVSFLDLQLGRYRHVELVVPTANGFGPLRVHAGGLAWHGTRMYVAATKAGLWVCDTGDVVLGPDGYLLPVGYRLQPSEPFRFSFVGLDDVSEPPRLVVGEYDTKGNARRLAHVGVDGGAAELIEGGIARAQGAVRVGDRWYVTASQGSRKLGSVWSGPAGALREHRYVVPMGPEDLAYDPDQDQLWTVTEHRGRRWVVSIKRSRIDRM